MTSGLRWFDLSPIWSLIETVGEMRETQKREFASSRPWRGDKSTHTIAIAGEVVASLMLKQPMDATLRVNGDVGYDLPDGTDVKTASYWPPILKHPTNSTSWPKYFALVYVDESSKRGCFIGRIKSSELRGGRVRKFRDDGPENFVLDMGQVIERSGR